MIRSCLKEACVYWIHLAEHTDFTKEGYVGVTSKEGGAEVRFKEHLTESRRKGYARYHIARAIKKYGETNIFVKTLMIGTDEYCYQMEFKLRPEANIGWNMAPGGQRPLRNPESFGDEWKDKLRQCNLGKIHTEDTKAKLSEISLYHHSRPEYRKRLLDISNSKKVSEVPKERFWEYSLTHPSMAGEINVIADKVYEKYWENQYLTAKDIANSLGFEEYGYQLQIVKLSRFFRAGWNPEEDVSWVNDYKFKES